MIKAVILDFYGTVVEESYALLDRVADVFLAHGARARREEIAALWWKEFRLQCDGAHGADFCLQRELYPRTLERMMRQTGAEGLDIDAVVKEIIAFAVSSPMFEDARRFLQKCPLPYYILSNIDNAEIEKIVARHGLRPSGIYTSEDAREYKPRKGIFEKGLQRFGLRADEAVYAGDSFRNDYEGARGAGMLSFWLNRRGETGPDGCRALPDLEALLPALEILRKESEHGDDLS